MTEPFIFAVGSPLDDNVPLWRYVRTSTLLMLLENRVFVPTIETLRKDDPSEATQICARTAKRFKNLSEEDCTALKQYAEKEALDALAFRQTSAEQITSIYFGIWKREIGKRRCAWCWYEGDIESMAQWHIYAPDGVAIRTTPARITAAFAPAHVRIGIFGRVKYSNDASTEDVFQSNVQSSHGTA